MDATTTTDTNTTTESSTITRTVATQSGNPFDTSLEENATLITENDGVAEFGQAYYIEIPLNEVEIQVEVDILEEIETMKEITIDVEVEVEVEEQSVVTSTAPAP